MTKGEKKKSNSKKLNGHSKKYKTDSNPLSSMSSGEAMDITSDSPKETSVKEKKNPLALNISLDKTFDVFGGKGHNTYFTQSTFDVGHHYFEVEMLAPKYNINDYVMILKRAEDSKKGDEFIKKYYSEIIDNSKKYQMTLRVGVCHKDGDLELPVGANEFSYSYKSSDGLLLNNGQYISGNSSYKPGDIVGVLVHIKTPMPTFLKQDDSVEKNTKGVAKNKENYIKFFVNGELQSESVVGLWEGSYHVAVTLYNYASATIRLSRKDLRYISIIENEVKNVKLLEKTI